MARKLSRRGSQKWRTRLEWKRYQTEVGGEADDRYFAPYFLDSLEARMLDESVGDSEQVFNWFLLRAPGNWSTWVCARDPRTGARKDLHQEDCQRETGLAKQRVSEQWHDLKARGWIIEEAGHTVLLRKPTLTAVPDPKPDRQPFLELWNAAHPEDVIAEQEARRILADINTRRLAEVRLMMRAAKTHPAPGSPDASPFSNPERPDQQPPPSPPRSDSEAEIVRKMAMDIDTRAVIKPNEEEFAPSAPVSNSFSGLMPASQPSSGVRGSDQHAGPAGRLAEVEQFLLDHLGTRFPGEVPGPALCSQIAVAVGDMPLAELLPKLQRRSSKLQSMGGVLPIAAEVRSRWEQEEPMVTLPGMRPVPRSEAIAELKRCANDPDPEVRRSVEEQLKKLGELRKGAS